MKEAWRKVTGREGKYGVANKQLLITVGKLQKPWSPTLKVAEVVSPTSIMVENNVKAYLSRVKLFKREGLNI